MRALFLGPAVTCLVLIAVLLGLTWVFGGYDGLSLSGGLALTIGIIAPVAVGFAFMDVILKGRRSRRDRMVDRARDDG